MKTTPNSSKMQKPEETPSLDISANIASAREKRLRERGIEVAYIGTGDGDDATLRATIALAVHEGAKVLIVGDAQQPFSCGPEPIKLVAEELFCITPVKNPFELPNNRKGRRMQKFAKNKKRFFEEVMRKPKFF